MVPKRRGGATQGKAPMFGLEALRSCRYAKVQPTAAAQPAARQLVQRWYRGRGGAAASRAGVCTVAMLLLVVPLFTLEADARGGGGGFGGHGGGFGGHGGFAGRGGMGFAARGGGLGFGGARSFGVARFGGAGGCARSLGGGPLRGSRACTPPFRVAR